MRSRRYRRTRESNHAKAERARRKAVYMDRLTPDQLAAWQAEREYVAYRAENKPVRRARPSRRINVERLQAR